MAGNSGRMDRMCHVEFRDVLMTDLATVNAYLNKPVGRDDAKVMLPTSKHLKYILEQIGPANITVWVSNYEDIDLARNMLRRHLGLELSVRLLQQGGLFGTMALNPAVFVGQLLIIFTGKKEESLIDPKQLWQDIAQRNSDLRHWPRYEK